MKKSQGKAPKSAVGFGLGLMLSCIFPTGLSFFILGAIILWLAFLLAKRR